MFYENKVSKIWWNEEKLFMKNYLRLCDKKISTEMNRWLVIVW